MPSQNVTIALSLLVHGEAMRPNRGKSQGDDFNFKHLKGNHGGIYPYISSQCFKKYWREALPTVPSPIKRGISKSGEEKNQVYTDGNPILYVDDDLFGYMVAGATDEEEQSISETIEEKSAVGDEGSIFAVDDIRDPKELLKKFKDAKTPICKKLKDQISDLHKADIDKADLKVDLKEEIFDILVNALNSLIEEPNDVKTYRLTPPQKKALENGLKTPSQIMRELLENEFKDALEPKRPTTRRTAPIRMHALVAFSGIKTAKDFQTFSRDTALTGKNSVLNPATVGFYSGWLKTRILIEGHRIGKFYVGSKNLDILDMHIGAFPIKTEPDPYTRTQTPVRYLQLEENERVKRMQMALEALSNIGNRQGPASGALHDGSLKPKGFIGAFMQCCDSPFDSIWEGTDDEPFFNKRRLKAVLTDWEDLFLKKTIYIGFPIEFKEDISIFKANLLEYMKGSDFEFEINTPRKAMKTMSETIASLGKE